MGIMGEIAATFESGTSETLGFVVRLAIVGVLISVFSGLAWLVIQGILPRK